MRSGLFGTLPLSIYIYINGVLGPGALGQFLYEILVSGGHYFEYGGLLINEIEYGGFFTNVIQYNIRIFFCGGLRRQQIQYVKVKMSSFMFLTSRDLENQVFHVTMIRFEIFNVFRR